MSVELPDKKQSIALCIVTGLDSGSHPPNLYTRRNDLNSHIQKIKHTNLGELKMPRFLILLLSCLMFSSQALALDFGLAIHGNTDPAIADLMKARNFKTARQDLTANTNVADRRAHVSRIRANGGRVEVTLQNSYQWNNTCPQDFANVEAKSYNEAYAIVDKYKDIIYDYELLNEISLRPETKAEVPWNSAGTSTAPYEGKPCYATMVSVLKGMSRAIRDIKASSGYPLRVILGAVGRDFGFLTFMRQKGVVFDVVGWHIYPHASNTSLLKDSWYGTGGPLARLAVYNLPVHINEFNCGEIYDGDYDNNPGSAKTLACFQAYKKHVSDLYNQNLINLESLHIYELLDEPKKSGPESRFGLMYDLNKPKDHLYIITAFAGGNLSASEQQRVTSLGILTDTEIASYQERAGNTPVLALHPPTNLRVNP